ncbi:MAG: hypothetical protein KDL10_05020, partial [Kiritimatiellae bacterium]|nr:hypothetical protein [Kiritimatiellia bacterium]
RGLRYSLAVLAVGGVLLLLLLVGLVGTQAGRQMVVNRAMTWLDQTAVTVRVEGLAWPALSTFTAASFSIADADGVWLVGEDAVLSLSLSALLHRSVEVQSASVRMVVVHRRPGYPGGTNQSPSTVGWVLHVQDASVDRLMLMPEVTGTGIEGPLQGQLGLSASRGSLALTSEQLSVASLDLGLRLQGSWSRDGQVVVRGWLGIQDGVAEGEGRYDLVDRLGTASLVLDQVPLSLAGQIGELPLSGRIDGAVSARWSVGALQAGWDVLIKQPAYTNFSADTLVSTGSLEVVQGETNPDAHAWIGLQNLNLRGHTVDVARASLSWLDGSWTGDRGHLLLTDGMVKTAGGVMDGEGRYDLTSGKVEGSITTERFSLNPVGATMGLAAVQGYATVACTGEWEEGRWLVHWEGVMDEPAYGVAAAGSLVSTGTVTWAGGDTGLMGVARLEASRLTLAKQTMDVASVHFAWNDGQFDTDLHAGSHMPFPWRLQVSGSGEARDGLVTGWLQHAEGAIRHESFAITDPVAFLATSNRWQIQDLRATWDGGEVVAEISRQEGFSTTGQVRGLNLDWLGLTGRTGLQGGLSGEWNLELGHVAQKGRLALGLESLSSIHPEVIPYLPTETTLTAQLTPTGLVVQGRAEGGAFQAFTVEGAMPLTWSPAPPWIALHTHTSLTAQVRGTTQLGLLMTGHLPEWQAIAGDVNLALDFAGTFDNPRILGTIALTNGLFEDVSRGTEVTSIVVRLTAEPGPHLTLSASATDGMAGTAMMTGSAHMVDGTLQLEGAADIAHFIAARAFG